MFDFGGANTEQIRAIKCVDGPVRVISGPGTGKTFTVVRRVAYLIQELNVLPKKIMIVTFTDKAARELITRISMFFSEKGISANISEMYIGTFHSICLRLLKEYDKSNTRYRIIDSFEQQYLIYRNFNRFRQIDNFEFVFEGESTWEKSKSIAEASNRIIEELIDPQKLQYSKNVEFSVIGKVIEEYFRLLEKENEYDFSLILFELYRLLKGKEDVLSQIQNQFEYIIVDEYLDTNRIQERLILLIGENHNNICVVGDEDQSLYRFRGARATNIINFPKHFGGKCETIVLEKNYRSRKSIVDFYNRWMKNTLEFEWGNSRYDKQIESSDSNSTDIECVYQINENGDKEEYNRLYHLICDLKNRGLVSDYNQIVFLFKSVKSRKTREFYKYLESHEIHVNSPRSELFFERDEIKLLIGVLLSLFPKYSEKLEDDTFKISRSFKKY